MTLDTQIVDVPLAGGPNNKLAPDLLPVGAMSLLEHCYQRKSGQIRCRPGFTSKGVTDLDGNSITAGKAVASINDELLLLDGEKLYSWGDDCSRWISRGRCKLVDVDAQPSLLQRVGYGNNTFVAVIGTSALYVVNRNGSGAGSVAYQVVDTTTGALLLSGTISFSSGDFMIGAVARSSSSFAILYGSGAVKQVLITGVGSSSLAAGAPSTLHADVPTEGHVHGRIVNGSPAGFTIAYVTSTPDVRVREYSSSSSLSQSYTITPVGAGIALPRVFYEGIGDATYVVYWDGADVAGWTLKAICLTSAFAVSWGPTTVLARTYSEVRGFATAIVADDDTALLHIFFEATYDDTSGTYYPYDQNNYYATMALTDGTLTGPTAINGGALRILSGIAWVQNSRAYVLMGLGQNQTQEPLPCAVIVGDEGDIVARLLTDTLGAQTFDVSPTEYVAVEPYVSGSEIRVALQQALRLSVGGSGYDYGLRPVVVDFAPQNGPSRAVVRNSLLLAGGVPRIYDGEVVAELDWGDSRGNAPTGASTGGVLSDGTYGIAVVFYWQDSKGAEHYSRPFLFSVTLSGGTSTQRMRWYDSGHATGTFPMIRWGAKTNGKFLLYRTAASGTIYYLETTVDNDTTVAAKDVSVGTTSGVTPLRTTGGVIAPTAPPAALDIAASDVAAVLLPADDTSRVMLSKPLEEGVAAEFSSDLLYEAFEGGPCVGARFLDNRLLLWKANQIRELVGELPDARGVGGFTGARVVSEDVGLKSARSLVRVPEGWAFQSSKGFYLVDRSLQVIYIGAPAADYDTETVLAAVVVEDLQQVRFVMSSGDILVWDYYHRTWPRFPGLDAVDATMWKGSFCFVNSSGEVYVEDSAAGLDTDSAAATSAIHYKWRTGWLRLQALRGFQRVRKVQLLGSTLASTQNDIITLKLYRDFDLSSAGETPLTGADSNSFHGTAANTPVAVDRRLATQKCTALALEFEGYSEQGDVGLAWTAMSFEVGVKKGMAKLANAKRI